MSDIQQQIFLTKNMEPIIVFSLREVAVQVAWTAGSCIKYLPLKVAQLSTKQKIFLVGLDLVALEKIWRELVLSPKKLRLFISVTIACPVINMELHSYMKYYFDILPCGVR